MSRTLGTYTLNDTTIEYSIAGRGEPILVMHGGHSNCREVFGYESLLKNGYSLITPSRAGYGNTSKEAGESLLTASKYYKKLLSHLKLEKVHLLAMSAGGPSGITFAAQYPENVVSLTLQSAVTKEWLTFKDKEYKAARILFRPSIEKYTWSAISTLNNLFPEFIFKQMFSSFSSSSCKEAKDVVENDIEEVRKMNNRQRSGSGFLIDLAQVNELHHEDLQAISCPALVMHSLYDGSVPVKHAHYAAEAISNADLQLLDTWGHLIWLGRNAGKTDECLLHFLKKHPIDD